MRWWWQARGVGVVEELRKVAYLQGQLDQTINSLTSSLAELQEILEPTPRDEEGAADA